MQTKYIISSIVLFFSILSDQISKLIVVENIGFYEKIIVIKNFFHLVYVKNTGVTFGMLRSLPSILKRPILIILPICIMGFILYLLIKTKENEKITYIALSLILGGAIGNIIDRIRLDYVVDFFHFNVGFMWWPAFNIADALIVAGMFLLAFEILRGKKILF